jgi:hypothetical protein
VADSPDHHPRPPAPQPCQRQLHLHAALVAHQFVPFIDDHGIEPGKTLLGIGLR